MAPPSMTDPIVVGYDGSSPSEVALQWAAQAAEHRALGLVVLHAAEPIEDTQYAGPGEREAADVVAQATEVAERGRDKVRETFPHLSVEASGSSFNATVALGESSAHASMVVMGNHRRSLVDTLLFGSTAYAIAGYARCPLVIVREGASDVPGPDRPVVVGVDGSEESDRAADAGAEMAEEWGATLCLVTTWVAAPPHQRNQEQPGYVSSVGRSQTEESKARHANDMVLKRVSSAHGDLDVRGTVVEAEPVDGLVEAAERGGLLVLGARVHGLSGAVLGSTSLGVLQEAASPIMIID